MARPKKITESGELEKVTFKADSLLVADIKGLAAAQGFTFTDLMIKLMEHYRYINRAELQEYYNRRERFRMDDNF